MQEVLGGYMVKGSRAQRWWLSIPKSVIYKEGDKIWHETDAQY